MLPENDQELSSVMLNDRPQIPKNPSFVQRHGLFLLCVVLPTLFAIFYFGFYASDIFVSESSYVVRSPHQKSSSSGGLGALLGGGGSHFSRAQDDIFTISEFVTSRDAMQVLNEKMDLAKSWQSHQIDLLHRFDPLGWDNSKEALYEYYLKRVNAIVDPLSGITKLTVSVFSPEESFEVNKHILGLAEQKVNMLNDRARNDLIRFAEAEVTIAENKAKAAAQAVSDFRNKEGVVDPEAQTNLHFSHISQLQQELVKTRTQLAQLKVFAPQSPHPPALEQRKITLEKEIAKEMEQITGGKESLATKASIFERLRLEREFAAQQLASALASLETARNEAQRQQLYLETIAKPNLPDTAILPNRFTGVLATFVVSFVVWGVLSMLISGIKEHKS
jgi:capsular polysaccharide transport system permease protein